MSLHLAGLSALLLCLPAFLAPGAAQDPAAEDLERFAELLGELRAGRDEAATELLEIGERLGEGGRADALEVARFYRGLSSEARRLGLAEMEAFGELNERTWLAGELGLSGEDWQIEREDIEGGLRGLVERVSSQEDPAPAGYALGLLAHLALEQAEHRFDIDEVERGDLLGRAECDARAAREAFERVGMVRPQLEPLWLLGRVERLKGDWRAAREAFSGCLGSALALDTPEYAERALWGLHDLARDAGDEGARARLHGQIARLRPPAESWELCREHADRLLQDDQPEEALAFLEQYAPAEGAPDADLVDWDVLMSKAYQRLGRPASMARHVERLGDEADRATAALANAWLLLEEGRSGEIAAALANAEGFGPRNRAWAHHLLGEAALGLGDLAGAQRELEFALEIAERWEGRLAGAFDQGARGVLGEWIGLHTVAQLAWVRAQLGRPLQAARAIESYQSRSLHDPALLRALARAGAVPPGVRVTDAQIRGWAQAYELGLVTWVIGPDFGISVWVSRDGRAVAQRFERGRSAIARAARRLREAALAGRRDQLERLASQIAIELFPSALRDELSGLGQGARAPRLLLLLHGPMESLPVELLRPLGSRGPLLDELVSTVCLPGLVDSSPGVPPDFARLSGWRVLGAPVGSEALAPALSGAREELEAVAERVDAEIVRIGADFDRAEMETALSSGAPLHVATHLLPADRCSSPRFSATGLLLSGGDVLCAQEIAALSPDPPLAVLSACETAGGDFVDAEGLQGVARAFLEGGTRSLVVTQWPVDDAAASRFALELHAALKAGEPPSAAVRTARRALREAGHPEADWAAFRVLGRD